MVVIIRKPALEFLLDSPAGSVGRHLAEKGAMISVAAKAQVGVRTEALKNSIHVRHFRDSRGQSIKVGSPLNYALAHHEGTKPHIIKPKRAQVLRFTRGSAVVYAHSVMHPGTEPNKFLTDNLGLIK